MSQVIHSNEQNFKKDALESKKITLVYFWAEWCGPCITMSPKVEEFAKKTDNVNVVKINVDESQQLASKYGVMSIPTLFVFKNGEIVDQNVGVLSVEQLKSLVDKN